MISSVVLMAKKPVTLLLIAGEGKRERGETGGWGGGRWCVDVRACMRVFIGAVAAYMFLRFTHMQTLSPARSRTPPYSCTLTCARERTRICMRTRKSVTGDVCVCI